MDKLTSGLLVLSLALNILLGVWLISFIKSARGLKDTISDIRQSGMQRRVHFGLKSKSLSMVTTELNILMDEFQSILEKKKMLELSQKQLISNISHDIRTPLTSIMGYIEVLKTQKKSSDKQCEYLDIIYAKACSMHDMIEEFFELAKLESEDRQIELSHVVLNNIIQEAAVSFYKDFTEKSITPHIEIPKAPVIAWGNLAAIERILGNLLTNALKYGADGGFISITLREDGEKAQIDVTDHGKGIPEQDLPYIFERLYKADAARNASTRGAGLGLAISRQLVQKQNGDIIAESIPGTKTVFSFYLNKV